MLVIQISIRSYTANNINQQGPYLSLRKNILKSQDKLTKSHLEEQIQVMMNSRNS